MSEDAVMEKGEIGDVCCNGVSLFVSLSFKRVGFSIYVDTYQIPNVQFSTYALPKDQGVNRGKQTRGSSSSSSQRVACGRFRSPVHGR